MSPCRTFWKRSAKSGMEGYKQAFIEFMVRSGALSFGDFTTKSGRKSPYFVNTGNYVSGSQIGALGDFYAQCIHHALGDGFDALFGPSYKGIPLAVASAIGLQQRYGKDVRYCFNRKEAKNHGEGGILVGSKLRDGDRVVITEDVVTAGTSVRETLPILTAQASVKVVGLVVSVDRMEKGQGEKTAIRELYEEFGIRTYPIVTVREIIDALYNREVDGKVVIDDTARTRMEAYFSEYCVNE